MTNNDSSPTNTTNQPEIVQPESNTEVTLSKRSHKRLDGNRNGGWKLTQEQKGAILREYMQGTPKNQIARTFCVAQNTINHLVNKWLPVIKNLTNCEAYEANRAQFLTAGEITMFEKMMSPKVLNKANLYTLTNAFDKLANHRRLELGQATGITSNLSLNFDLAKYKPS